MSLDLFWEGSNVLFGYVDNSHVGIEGMRERRSPGLRDSHGMMWKPRVGGWLSVVAGHARGLWVVVDDSTTLIVDVNTSTNPRLERG